MWCSSSEHARGSQISASSSNSWLAAASMTTSTRYACCLVLLARRESPPPPPPPPLFPGCQRLLENFDGHILSFASRCAVRARTRDSHRDHATEGPFCSLCHVFFLPIISQCEVVADGSTCGSTDCFCKNSLQLSPGASNLYCPGWHSLLLLS